MTSLAQALSPAEATAGETAARTPPDWRRRLLLALLVLWPVEIAMRRRWMPWL